MPAKQNVNSDLTYPVTNSTVDYGNNIRRIWGVEWPANLDVVYKFSNGRVFRDSCAQGGPYGPQDD